VAALPKFPGHLRPRPPDDIAAARYANRLAHDPEAPAFEQPAGVLRGFEMASFAGAAPQPDKTIAPPSIGIRCWHS